jgi:ubiquinone/menaquinone biosynthesis C-methylase UbiE
MSFMKKVVASSYSFAADRFYDRVVVNGGFRLLGGNLNDLVVEQGRRAVEFASGDPILDMPVGTAFFTVKLARVHHGLVIGSDIAEGMVVKARTIAMEAGITNLQMVQADAHHIPFADGSFAAVMCTNSLQVVPGLRPSVAELARVTRPGGRLFVSVLTLPAPRLVREARKGKLPTAMLSGNDIAEVLEDHGLWIDTIRHDRLATLIEADKPAS